MIHRSGPAARRSSLVLALTSLFAILFATLPARAHPARTSAVLLDIGQAIIEAEIQVPVDQLGLALDTSFEPSPEAAIAERTDLLRDYVLAHFGAETPDRRSFDVRVRTVSAGVVDGGPALVVRASLAPPEGAGTLAFTLRDDVVLHRVVSHKTFVSVRRDLRTAVFADRPELAGVIRYQRESLVIDRSSGSWWKGVAATFAIGTRHIAEGTDHLLFLLVLLLPAPLVARGGRWREGRGVARSAREVLKIVTAFTIGHSLTLIAASTRLVRAPSAPVEILVALSILVSAAHAVRPLVRGGEPVIAAGFGLVHGLAFAETLSNLGVDTWSLGVGLLGFNLGIEAMQIFVVLFVMPWLILLARTGKYDLLRVCGALFGGLAACGWLSERALGTRNPFAPAVDLVFRHGALAILVAAALVLLASRLSAAPQRTAAEARSSHR